jgi:hypothetical protein
MLRLLTRHKHALLTHRLTPIPSIRKFSENDSEISWLTRVLSKSRASKRLTRYMVTRMYPGCFESSNEVPGSQKELFTVLQHHLGLGKEKTRSELYIVPAGNRYFFEKNSNFSCTLLVSIYFYRGIF